MHSISTSPSHCPGSGQELRCWHGAFERNRPNKKEKRGITSMEASPATHSRGIWTCPFPARPQEAWGGPGKSFSISQIQGITRSPQLRLGVFSDHFYEKLMNLPDF